MNLNIIRNGLKRMLQVVTVEEVDYAKRCVSLINELEAAGLPIPAKIDQSLYKK